MLMSINLFSVVLWWFLRLWVLSVWNKNTKGFKHRRIIAIIIDRDVMGFVSFNDIIGDHFIFNQGVPYVDIPARALSECFQFHSRGAKKRRKKEERIYIQSCLSPQLDY